jgi:hypothetical protein
VRGLASRSQSHAPPEFVRHALYDREVYNRQHLPAPWQGWRFSGRVLVSSEGDRISPERLRGLLWRERLASRQLKALKRACRLVNGSWDRVRALGTRREDQPAGWVKRIRRALPPRPSRLAGLINMVVQLPQQIERAGQAHPFQRLVSMLLGCCAPLVTHTGFGHAGAGMRTSC